MTVRIESVQPRSIYLRINNRLKIYHRIRDVQDRGNGIFTVYIAGFDEPFIVEGGRRAGGRKTDWFVDGPGLSRTIKATSLVDALNLIDGM